MDIKKNWLGSSIFSVMARKNIGSDFYLIAVKIEESAS